MSLNIALCGFYGKNNFGDDLMQDCLSEVLSSSGKNKIHVFSDCERTNIENGLLNKKHLQCDLVIIGGGGIINKNFWTFKNGGIDELINSKKEIIFLNVNVYKDILKENAFIEKLKLLNSKWWVRDFESQKNLSEIGIDSIVMPDIAFYKTKRFVEKRENKKLIFFPNHYPFFSSFTNLKTSDWLLAQKNIFLLADYFDWLIHFGWEITISFAQHGGSVDDRVIGAMIFAHVKNKNKINWDIIPVSWEEKIELIKKYELVLSMRYHTTLVAVMNGIPCIDIIHHDKNKYFWRDLQFINKSLNMYMLDSEQLCNSTNFFYNFSDYLNKIDEYCIKSTEKWTEFEQFILNKKRND